MKRFVMLVAVVLAMTSCETDAPVSPQFARMRAGSPALNVVSYNVYWGAQVEELMTTAPEQIPMVAAGLWGDVLETNFPERAVAIAKQIEAADAQVVGLQEVALYRFEETSDFEGGELPTPDAQIVLIDFLDVLIDALETRGLYYRTASKSQNMDIELPMCTNAELCLPLADIRLTDYDVVLVREDVDFENAVSGNFAAQLPVPVGEQVLLKPSGWASADIILKGKQYRFVNAHLEPADVLPGGGVHPEIAYIQAMQLAELLEVVDESPHPVVLVGDLNSDSDGGTTPTYQDVLDAGFVDAWLAGRPRGSGFTANQSSHLNNENSELFHRIDFIFYRDEFTTVAGKIRGSVAAEILGEEQTDKTASGLWPSDHAGVAAVLRIEQGIR